MKNTLIICFLCMILSHLNAQNQSDSIEVTKKMGTVFRQHGKILTVRQLQEITRSNSKAYNEMKIANSNATGSFIFGFAGGALIGWPIGSAIGGGKPNWALAGIGAGLVVLSIPFSVGYTKHAKSAVRIYNAGLKPIALNKFELIMGLTSNGIGAKINF